MEKYNGFNENKSPIHGVGGGKDLLSSSEEQYRINELLKRRFKATAVDTSENFSPGMIANLDVDPDGDEFIYFKETNTIIYYPSKYPHLFEELPWWSDREESEMPKYLKITVAKNEEDRGVVFLVDRYEAYYVGDAEIPHWSYLAYSSSIIDCMPMIFCDPATEAEYLNYQNIKK